jgi:hypothetical protein
MDKEIIGHYYFLLLYITNFINMPYYKMMRYAPVMKKEKAEKKTRTVLKFVVLALQVT